MNFKKNSLIFIIKLNEILNKSFILVYCNIFVVYFFSYCKYIFGNYFFVIMVYLRVMIPQFGIY